MTLLFQVARFQGRPPRRPLSQGPACSRCQPLVQNEYAVQNNSAPTIFSIRAADSARRQMILHQRAL